MTTDGARSRLPSRRERGIAAVVMAVFIAVPLGVIGRGALLLWHGPRGSMGLLDTVCWVFAWMVAFVIILVALCMAIAAVFLVLKWMHWALTTPPAKPTGLEEEPWV
jgi:hypothetical protein